MLIDPKLCYRKGRTIVIVHVQESVNEAGERADVLTRESLEYSSINAAKRANRATKYRVVRL